MFIVGGSPKAETNFGRTEVTSSTIKMSELGSFSKDWMN